MDRYGRIHFAAVAVRFARVIADPAVRRRQRVVGDQRLPSPAEIAGLGMGKPALDILPGGTGVVAGRAQVGPHRMTGTKRSGAMLEGQVDDRRQIARSHWASLPV